MDTVFVDGMNMGWEMPGTYDARMEVKDLSLRSYVGTTYEKNDGIVNIPVGSVEENVNVTVDEQLSLNVPKYLIDMDGIEESMLILQAVKRNGVDGVSIPGYDVEEIYDIGAWVNGMQFNRYDNDLAVTYTPGFGNVKDLHFFTINSSGEAKAVDVTYDEASNTVTFALSRAAVLAIATEAPVVDPDPLPPTGDTLTGVVLCMMLLGLAGACIILPEKRKF